MGQSNLLQALGWAVFNSLWQMAILWVAYQLIVTIFRIRKSSRRSFLAASLLFAGFAWFTVTLVAAFASKEVIATQGYAVLLNAESNSTLNNWLNTMLPVASILYLLLLILPILNFIRNYRYVQIIRHHGLSRADVSWRMFVQKICVRMDIRKPVQVWMSELVTSPVTIGYLKPIILLPLAAVNHLSTLQTEAVLLHELSHIRRYDYFVNLLTKLIQTILYFNPFVKAFARIMETEREKSCDETVIQFQYEAHGYASALLILEKTAHISRHTLAVGASDGRKSEFRQRIERIMGIHKTQIFSLQKFAGVLGALLFFIALNAFLIMSKPVKTVLANDSFSFLASPYEYFADDIYDKSTNAEYVAENKTPVVINSPAETTPAESVPEQDMKETESPEDEIALVEAVPVPEQPETASPLHFVYQLQQLVPQLKADQEKQIEQAMTESKRVLKEIQWKEVENGIADALTRMEKEKVKAEYEKSLKNIDWGNLEIQLRIAYDNINWNKINLELNHALAAIRLDSLQQVYTIALDQLSHLQKELVKVNEPGIPDTDVTLKSIEIKKKQVQKVIDKIRTVRPKKVVQL